MKVLKMNSMDDIPNFGPVIIKFGATWCASCKNLTKVLEKKDVDFPVIEIDVDQEVNVAKTMNIRSLPTMAFLMDGVEIKRYVGYKAETIDEFLKLE